MRMSLAPRGIAFVALAILLTGCAVPQPRGKGKLERVTEPTTKRAYWLYLPSEYVKSSDDARKARRWPTVVSFHGMKPFDNAYPQAREWEQEADRYGLIVVAPELESPDVLAEFPLRTIHPAFRRDEQTTLAILDHVFSATRADRNNVLSTSWSSGGYMAHYMLNRHPDRFSCLAVRQSNFSRYVLDPNLTERSQNHPVLILNTENDFAVCKKESAEAVNWYTEKGYRNIGWIHIKNYGHERTPDTAAAFFGRVAGVEPASPPTALMSRQAINGNAAGLAFLSGQKSTLTTPAAPNPPVMALTEPTPRPATPERVANPAASSATMQVFRPAQQTGSGRAVFQTVSTPRSSPAQPGNVATAPEIVSVTPTRNPPASSSSQRVKPASLNIRVSSTIGLEPLHLGFSAECPQDWYSNADFLWTLNGQVIGAGLNGHKTISQPGEHALGLLVVTTDGAEHRASRTVRVLPRSSASVSSGGLSGASNP